MNLFEDKLKLQFSKDYTIPLNNLGNCFISKRKKEKSGQYIISLSTYNSIAEIIFTEVLFTKIYGGRNLITNTHSNRPFFFNSDSNLYKLYIHSTYSLQGKFNKLITASRRESWDTICTRNAALNPYIKLTKLEFYDELKHAKNDTESLITPAFLAPQIRDNTQFIKLASEFSIAGDMCWLTLTIGTFNPEEKKDFNPQCDTTTIGGVINGMVDTLNFSILEEKQREEFKDFNEQVLERYIRESLTITNMVDRAYSWAKLTLTNRRQNQVKKKVMKILFE